MLVAAAVAAADAGRSFATGSFQGLIAGEANQNIAFTAHRTPAGRVVGQVTETIVINDVASKLRANVVCLAVSGNRAAIGFEVLQSTGILTNPYSVGSIHSLIVQDSDAGDTFAFISIECTAAVNVEPVFPIKHGNITVHS
jgi:hypothetical protein